jgi:hypothetical protein
MDSKHRISDHLFPSGHNCSLALSCVYFHWVLHTPWLNDQATDLKRYSRDEDQADMIHSHTRSVLEIAHESIHPIFERTSKHIMYYWRPQTSSRTPNMTEVWAEVPGKPADYVRRTEVRSRDHTASTAKNPLDLRTNNNLEPTQEERDTWNQLANHQRVLLCWTRLRCPLRAVSQRNTDWWRKDMRESESRTWKPTQGQCRLSANWFERKKKWRQIHCCIRDPKVSRLRQEVKARLAIEVSLQLWQLWDVKCRRRSFQQEYSSYVSIRYLQTCFHMQVRLLQSHYSKLTPYAHHLSGSWVHVS